jgi:hypothetical protein
MATLPTIPASQLSRSWTVTFPVDSKWLADDPRYVELREKYENEYSDAFLQRWAVIQPPERARHVSAAPHTCTLQLMLLHPANGFIWRARV